MLTPLIEERCRELDLAPAYFVQRLGKENITDTYDYLKGFDEDLKNHPMPKAMQTALARALEVSEKKIEEAVEESREWLSSDTGRSWKPGGLTPHANIILYPREEPAPRGWTAILARVNTRIDFSDCSDPKTFVAQAVKALKFRDLKGRKFHSVVVNYAWEDAVRYDAEGNEIERILPKEKLGG